MYASARTSGRMGTLDAFVKGVPAELTTFVQKTYGMLAFSVMLGAAACWAMLRLFPVTVETVIESGAVHQVVRTAFPSWGIWVLWGGTFGFSIWGSMARRGARSGEASFTGLVALVGMVLCSGAMIAPTIGMFLGAGMANTVAGAALITAATFTALTAYVLISGKNFSFLGGFLTVAIIAFFVAWLANGLFIQSAGFQWWMAAAGSLLFCGFILFDTSAVVRFYGPNNLVVPAVIALYLDIFNLFLMLLVLLSGRRSD